MTEITVPYRDPSVAVEQRVEDLLGRMSLEDKAGLMFHDMVVMGPGGQLAGDDNMIRRPATAVAITRLRVNHFNLVGTAPSVRELAAWPNGLQEQALATDLGIPVTLSTDPRARFHANPGTAAEAGQFSARPEPLGLAAIVDTHVVEQFADTARPDGQVFLVRHGPATVPVR